MRPNDDNIDRDRSSGRAERQRLWLHLQRRPWQTLAVVPAQEGIPAYDAAIEIMEMGAHHGESIVVVDARKIEVHRVGPEIAAASEDVRRGNRVVFVTSPIEANLVTIPLARAVSGVVLCVSIGSTLVRSVEEAVLQIGKERFFGSVLARERRRASSLMFWRRRSER